MDDGNAAWTCLVKPSFNRDTLQLEVPLHSQYATKTTRILSYNAPKGTRLAAAMALSSTSYCLRQSGRMYAHITLVTS
jgi:hypothetical protein